MLTNGATFTGSLTKEDDKTVAIKMGGAEMQWDKSGVKEIIRFVDPNAPAGAGSDTKKIGWPFWK